NQVWLPIAECLDCRLAVSRAAHVIAMTGQASPENAGNLGFVVHDQDSLILVHRFQAVPLIFISSTCAVLSSSPNGSVSATRAPRPGPTSSIQMRPPCASTIPRAIASPIPVPEGCVPVSPSRIARKNLSNTRSRSSGGTPGPSSSTVNRSISSSALPALTLMLVPDDEYFAALSTRV